jgi:uncharacterized CHY-type Zn-finger protein
MKEHRKIKICKRCKEEYVVKEYTRSSYCPICHKIMGAKLIHVAPRNRKTK